MSWDMVELDGFCTFIDYRGKTPKKQPNGIPLVTAKNVSDRKLDFSIKEYIAVEDYDSWMTRGIPDKDDLLFTTEAPLGKVSLLGISTKVALAQRILAIRCSESGNNSRYLMYSFSAPIVWNQIVQRSSGSTVKGIRSKELRQVKIPLPPLETQKRIVELLDRAQALIDKRKEQIKLMDDLIQSLFYDMFGDPVTNPMGWEVCALHHSVLGKYGIKAGPFGSALKKTDYVSSGIRVYGQEQVIAGSFEIGDYYIDEHKFEKLKSCEVKSGDVLISLVGSFGKALIVPNNVKKGIINPRLLKISLNGKKLIPEFFIEMFRLASIQSKLRVLSHGGTMGILNAGILKELPGQDSVMRM